MINIFFIFLLMFVDLFAQTHIGSVFWRLPMNNDYTSNLSLPEFAVSIFIDANIGFAFALIR
jgi:hypothetical protein